MRVLNISTDRNICKPQEPAAQRQAAYGRCFERTDIIVLSLRSHNCEPVELENNVFVHPTNSRSRWLYWFDVLCIARALKKPDVLSVQDPFFVGLIGLLIARREDVPLHVQIHTDIYSPHFSWLHRTIARFVLQRARGVRVVSERIRESLTANSYKLKAEPTVLPIYVDIATYESITRIKHPHFSVALLFVGRLEKEKRAYKAIDTLAALTKAGHNAGLTIVGEGRERERLERHVQKRSLAGRVVFTGWQSDITEYLAQADLLLVPSQYEGYGMIIIEALAAGVPVLATDVGVASEAGAIIAPFSEFEQMALKWAKSGPRTGTLTGYPYRSFDEYVEAYCADIQACEDSIQ